jgi:uncharacterized membrane protein
VSVKKKTPPIKEISGWSFVDGNTAIGINKDASQDAEKPTLASFKSKLYAAWYEKNSSSKLQIRVVRFDGDESSPNWSFVDGGAANGINHDPTHEAKDPFLMSTNTKLHAIWSEKNSSNKFQIRVSGYDGNGWAFIGGDATSGINHDSSLNAELPTLVEFNSKLYATWSERAPSTSRKQIRVATYTGSTWNFVDRDATTGINFNVDRNAKNPQLVSFNSDLYVVWNELQTLGSTTNRIRVAKYNGNDASPNWSFVDGNSSGGINHDSSKNAENPHAIKFDSRLYVAWSETHPSSGIAQIRINAYDGNSWRFVDGDEAVGVNHDASQDAIRCKLVAFNSKIYLIWEEANPTSVIQTRISVYNGKDDAPLWTPLDGGGTNGLNKDTSKKAHFGVLAVSNSKLYAAWQEFDAMSKKQIRVVVGH